jgi:uncharacterized protein
MPPGTGGARREDAMVPTPRLTRRSFFKLACSAVAGAGGAGAYAHWVEPHWVEVVRRELPIAHLPPRLGGKLLVQLSDLHVGPDVDDGYLIRAFGLVGRLDPDVLALTGDFMTSVRGEEVGHALRVLARLRPARLATLAVLGNHDYGMGARDAVAAQRLAGGLRALGVEVLRNSARDVAGLTVAGLDDYWGPFFDPARVLSALDPTGANLVLCHNPDAVDRPGWCGYRGWVLSGHTHGGQCRPPFLRPPRLPVENKRYVAGEYDLGDGRKLYVNRALGHLLKVRFNVRPEITAFTLRRA